MTAAARHGDRLNRAEQMRPASRPRPSRTTPDPAGNRVRAPRTAPDPAGPRPLRSPSPQPPPRHAPCCLGLPAARTESREAPLPRPSCRTTRGCCSSLSWERSLVWTRTTTQRGGGGRPGLARRGGHLAP